VKTEYFSQPNLLAGRPLVPEFFQEQVRPEVLGPAVLEQLDRPDRDELTAPTKRSTRACAATPASVRPTPCWNCAMRGGAADETACAGAGRARLRRPGPVAGVDEAGRGPLAVRSWRPQSFSILRGPSTGWPTPSSSPSGDARRWPWRSARAARPGASLGRGVEVDALNILQATFLAMRRALQALGAPPSHVVVDGNLCPDLGDLAWPCTVEAVVRGDATVPAISAASILAKCARDACMRELEVRYPGYGFAAHKAIHRRDVAALRRLGPSPVHRRSFAPVQSCDPR